MDVAAAVLGRVLDILLAEEREMAELLALALEEQAALVESDFPAIASVSERMQSAAARIEAFEADRLNLLRTSGADALTLQELTPLADDLGIGGFAAARLNLASRAQALRDAQEQNARLLLNAMKLRDRWANLLGGMVAPGYGSDGRRQAGANRGTVSRSA